MPEDNNPVFTEKGDFFVYPEDACTQPVSKPISEVKWVGWLFLAAVVLGTIWVVVTTQASWYDPLITYGVLGGFFGICALFAWFGNRRP